MVACQIDAAFYPKALLGRGAGLGVVDAIDAKVGPRQGRFGGSLGRALRLGA